VTTNDLESLMNLLASVAGFFKILLRVSSCIHMEEKSLFTMAKYECVKIAAS